VSNVAIVKQQVSLWVGGSFIVMQLTLVYSSK